MNTNGVLSVPDDNPNSSTTPGRLTLLDDRVGDTHVGRYHRPMDLRCCILSNR